MKVSPAPVIRVTATCGGRRCDCPGRRIHGRAAAPSVTSTRAPARQKRRAAPRRVAKRRLAQQPGFFEVHVKRGAPAPEGRQTVRLAGAGGRDAQIGGGESGVGDLASSVSVRLPSSATRPG
jgi:hypothetical protein